MRNGLFTERPIVDTIPAGPSHGSRSIGLSSRTLSSFTTATAALTTAAASGAPLEAELAHEAFCDVSLEKAVAEATLKVHEKKSCATI